MLVNQLRAGGLDAVIVYKANTAQVREHLETIPIVLPLLVIGLSLLMVACAFAVRTMRTTFDQIRPRQEQVALTLGCSRSQAFWQIVQPLPTQPAMPV
jgi:molybdate transport system permease protein